MARIPLARRFWTKVDVRGPDECWNWKACKINDGYGHINEGGRKGRLLLAHRVSWELHHGTIGKGSHILHRCDNPACCNPAHLFCGTHQDNMTDMAVKGRMPSKLTTTDVVSIRELTKAGLPQERIAKQFDIAQTTVSKIILRKRWRHLL